jgi:hypothetical protein
MSSSKNVKPFETPVELIKKSFKVYRSKFSTFFVLGLIVFLVTTVQLFAIRTHSMFMFVLSVLATVVVSYIVYIAEIRVASDPAGMSIWETLRRVEHYIVPSAWVSLAIIIIALGGVLLFIVPAIIVSVLMMFSVFAVIIDHYEKTEAIIYSWHLVKERWIPIFGRLLLMNLVIGGISLVLIGSLWLVGVGETPVETVARVRSGDYNVSVSQTILSEAVANFFAIPLSIIFIAQLYESVKRTSTKVVTNAEIKKTKNILRVLALCGVIFVVGGIFLSSLRIAQVVPQLIKFTHAPAAVFSAF